MKKEKEFLESKSTISKKENLPNGFLSSDKRISDIIGKPNKNSQSVIKPQIYNQAFDK